MHGRTDARTHGRTDARTHGRTDARTHGRTDAGTRRRARTRGDALQHCPRHLHYDAVASLVAATASVATPVRRITNRCLLLAMVTNGSLNTNSSVSKRKDLAIRSR
jgi:hypothetical protein